MLMELKMVPIIPKLCQHNWEKPSQEFIRKSTQLHLKPR